MNQDRPVDPAWIAWAEQETIKQLRARLERTEEEQTPAEADGLSVVRDREVDEIDLRPGRAIRLPDPPGEALAAPGLRPALVASRANGLVVRIHRENL